jgi:hypothetical protein
MRTTITIDDDVASKLRPLLLRSNGKPKVVINDLLRKALGIKPKSDIDIPTFKMGLRQHIDPTSLNKVAEEILRGDAEDKYGR